MRTMTHDEATRLQAAEKYLLGELPQPLRDEYEEHYFDCAACALDIKAAAAFADTTREVLREQPQRERFRLKDAAPVPGGWFAWLRPSVAMPAFATLALLLVVGYQNTVTIPKLKESAPRAMAQAANTFSLLRANARGAEGVTVPIRPEEGISLTEIDIPPSPSFDGYVARLVDASGNSLLQTKISANQARSSVAFSVPPGSIPRPGVYSVVVTGDPGAKGQVISQNEVLRLSFTVAFRR
jgi:hypothetical protein